MGDVRQLALIPFRDTVLFPGSELPIYVGREATIRAIRYAKSVHNGDIAVFSQIKAENPGPIGAGDIYQIGTVAKIAASVEMTDQSIKGMLEGVERVHLENLTVVEGVTLVAVTALAEVTESGVVAEPERTDILSLLATWGSEFNRAYERAEYHTVCTSHDLTPFVTALCTLVATPRIDKPGVDHGWNLGKNPAPMRYRDLKNEAVTRRQKILEERTYEQKLKLLVEAMTFDVACRNEIFAKA